MEKREAEHGFLIPVKPKPEKTDNCPEASNPILKLLFKIFMCRKHISFIFYNCALDNYVLFSYKKLKQTKSLIKETRDI